jgi:hypothetical protein
MQQNSDNPDQVVNGLAPDMVNKPSPAETTASGRRPRLAPNHLY